ncbi:hypothetical protein EBB07_33805 [Paenibacillaceae bacterium]|nr:hypothetical protein EBB07_33805 [Paenibacillaceae bacterium]
MSKSQTKAAAPTYAKAQFLASVKYSSAEKDVLQVVLDDNQEYSEAEAQQRLQQFYQRKVD